MTYGADPEGLAESYSYAAAGGRGNTAAENPGSVKPTITSIPQVIHGVECYEAWRDDTDCPHELEVRHGA